ncbi:MAG: ribonuclease P protein component [Methylococcaceae bacterium]|nr:ribonuclease P protein component [Methylococcaceae bacterium]
MSKETFSFPDSLRLKTPTDFQQVFARPVKSTDRYFTLLAIKNELEHPRLGLAIAKKNIKRAVDRNKVKRVSRESFRLQQHNLITLDIVVLARRDAANASTAVLAKSLAKHWLKLEKQCASS